MSKKTHFGFSEVDIEQKAKMVKGVFDSVTDNYDLMNDLMSLGIHRLWKQATIDMASLQNGQRVLDLASGTGDLAAKMSALVGNEGRVIMSDINYKMLDKGRDKMINLGLVNNIDYVLADAENLPFCNDYFDVVTMAFGLRNVTNKQNALSSILKTIKPGGKLLVLEFSHPEPEIVNKLYDIYSFNILPKIGKLIADDESSYKYLAESIRKHPKQQQLQQMMTDAGFVDTKYHNLSTGIVAIHSGYKPVDI